MVERFLWAGDEFPAGDREIWEEQYMRGREVQDTGQVVELPAETAEERAALDEHVEQVRQAQLIAPEDRDMQIRDTV